MNRHYRLSDRPHFSRVSLDEIANQYGLPDLVPAIEFYAGYLTQHGPPDYTAIHYVPNRNVAAVPINVHFTAVDVWVQLRLHSRLTQDPDSDAPPVAVQALPPSVEYPYGRCNCILVQDTASAQTAGVKGTLIVPILIMNVG